MPVKQNGMDGIQEDIEVDHTELEESSTSSSTTKDLSLSGTDNVNQGLNTAHIIFSQKSRCYHQIEKWWFWIAVLYFR